MSDHIPFHIQREIMKSLPVKSLIQFRSVSKAWKSVIDSPEFIVAHSLHRHTQPQHLLVSYDNSDEGKNYVSFVDDGNFPQQRSLPTLPLSDEQSSGFGYMVAGSSHGLLCFYKSASQFAPGMVVVWNPSIRKSIAVVVPGNPSVGFGVCPVTSDPKIVAVTQSSWDVSCKVMIYTLCSRRWRSLPVNMPTEPPEDSWCSVVTDQFIYWRGSRNRMILSFDVTNENLELIDLPGNLANHPPMRLFFSKVRDSLAILQFKDDICTVWMMEDGVQRSFTKLFTIKTESDYIIGFTKSAIPLVQVIKVYLDEDDDEVSELVVYDPNLEQSVVIQTSGSVYSFIIHSYTETLLLHGRSDCSSC